jgi:branched-chain amino acid transport system permease protein
MEYFIHLGILISIYTILALSLNLIVGFTGLLSMAHAAFYGIGAYATAILLTSHGFGFFSSVLVGIAVAGLLALLFGLVISKFKGDYLALGSFGFNIIMLGIFVNWRSLTNGAMGISGITRPEIFGFSFTNNSSFLILIIVVAILVYVFCQFLVKSSFGRVLQAIREDEKAIAIFGYKTHYYKLIIFVLSAMLAALAGSFFAGYISFINPSSFGLPESIFILSIVILGGMANNRGMICGAVLMVLLPEALRFVGMPTSIAAEMRQIIYGLILVIFALYRPQGIMGKFKM